MNAHDFDTEALIEDSLKQAAGAYCPPAGLKQTVRETVFGRLREQASAARRRRMRWFRRSLSAVGAAAACLLIAAVVWSLLGGNGVASAYAELIEAVQKTKAAKWLHWRSQLDLKDLKGKSEGWISLDPFHMFNKLPNGMSQHIDARLARTYDPRTKTITITGLRGAIGPQLLEAKSFLDLMPPEIKATGDGAKVVKSHEGGLVVYTVDDGKSKQRFYVDPKARRMVRIEDHAWYKGERCVLTKEIDYPESGPTDIYDLGVPRDAKVVDGTGQDQAGQEVLLLELARIVKGPADAQWVHAVITGDCPYEVWVSVRPRLRVFWRNADRIMMIDQDELRRYEYDRKAGTLTVSREKKVANAKRIGNVRELMDEMLQMARREGTEIVKSSEVIDGKTRTIYTATREGRAEHRWVVDPVRNLPVRYQKLDTEGTDDGRVTVTFEYPKTGPRDIYDLGVPRDAKIVTAAAGPEARELSGFQRHFEQAIEALDARAEWPGTPQDVCKAYWQARAAKRFDEMAVLFPGSASFNSRLRGEKPVQYVFGEARKLDGAEGIVIVPYAAEADYKRHGTYNLKMHLTNRSSANGRYYITSAN